ncbi:MAG TPA: glycosyltransferase [Acidimicrobiales bacterium]|jgi:glycosyltransferase involved in cell wall biosynthesis
MVDIVVPVYNEAAALEPSIRRLHDYLGTHFPLAWHIVIVDNASTDRTWAIADRLSRELDGVTAMHLDSKGRGLALRTAWSASEAPVVAYMDVDLSTDLDALLPLVAPLVSGHSDVAIGTRLAPGSCVVRGPKREVISRGYNLLLKATLRSGFSDAQCGFKAIRTDVARSLLPLVEDDGWFFDTELLVLAERNGLRIHEVPVDWVDDPDSRVDVARTARTDLRGIARMLHRFVSEPGSVMRPIAGRIDRARNDDNLSAQLARFASIGVVSTALFAMLFVLLRDPLGYVGADVVALAICSIANTAANRRLTFALRGRAGRGQDYRAGLALGFIPLATTLATLAVLAIAGVTSLAWIVFALTATSALGALARFVLLRRRLSGRATSLDAVPDGTVRLDAVRDNAA